MKNAFDLSGRVVIVAGGAGFLGTPVCETLLRQGATVIIGDMKAERLAPTVEALKGLVPGANVSAVQFNAADEASIHALVDNTVRDHGRLDGFVNATFFSVGKKVEDLTAEEFDKANRVNVTASFLMARKAAGAMKPGASIVMFASMYGLVSPDPKMYIPPMNPNPIEYGAGKAAMVQITKYLAAHYGPRNIRVNAVAPGPFPFQSTRDQEPDFCKRLMARTMLGRLGRQDELAGTVAYLLSDASSYVTGICVSVDGGWTQW